jgi:hypothetical protein
MMKDPLNKAVQGLGPHVKALPEIGMGMTMFPDVTNPRSQPRGEAAASMLGFRDPYRAAKGAVLGDGTRARRHYWESLAGIATVDPRREALSEMHALRNRFLKNKGEPSDNIMATSAFATIRESFYRNDYRAFREAKAAYRKGGRGRTLDNFMLHLAYIDPMSQRLNDKDEREFTDDFLNDLQRQKLRFVRDYSDEMRSTLLSWWWRDVEENGDPEQIEETKFWLGKTVYKATAPPPVWKQSDYKKSPNDYRAKFNERKAKSKVAAEDALETLQAMGTNSLDAMRAALYAEQRRKKQSTAVEKVDSRGIRTQTKFGRQVDALNKMFN